MHLFAYQGGFRPYRQGFVDIFINVLKGLLVGIALGTLLGILSGSWVWLEMRVNVGRMIPAVMLVCLIIAVSKKAVFRYRFFLILQLFLITAIISIYGFDPAALRIVPACLIREGFQLTGISMDTVNIILIFLLIWGNCLWILLEFRAGRPAVFHRRLNLWRNLL